MMQQPQFAFVEELQSEYIYAEIFKALDMEGRELISQQDLFMVAKAAGWTPEQITDLV